VTLIKILRHLQHLFWDDQFVSVGIYNVNAQDKLYVSNTATKELNTLIN